MIRVNRSIERSAPPWSGNGTAGIAGSGAAHDQRQTVLIAQPRDCRDLLCRAGKQDDVGAMADLQRVAPIGVERRRIQSRVRSADERGQRRDQIGSESHVLDSRTAQ